MNDNTIFFHSENSFQLTNESNIKKWIKECIIEEGFLSGEINVIFCDDEYLLQQNINYLNHNTFTDIITFNYNKENLISGDLFISTDRVIENAKKFNVTFDHELKRVIIHGVLHLLSYNDKTDEEQVKMRERENYYLTKTS